ncbi:MAG: glutamate/cysteine ligase family protein, partial [Blastococcus sp.]|nr:glutamate/cysteine ligase family protein [Blastococcus sp.]
ADRALQTAARGCLAAALDAVPSALLPEVAALAALVDRGHSPGNAVLASACRNGPAAALLGAAEHLEGSP